MPHRPPFCEQLESRVCLSATAAAVTDPIVGRYVANDVATLNGKAMTVKFVLNIISTSGGMIDGQISSSKTGIFSFDAGFHVHSDGKFLVQLSDGAGTLEGRFIDGNTKFTGSLNATGLTHVVSTLDLKRNCGCQV